MGEEGSVPHNRGSAGHSLMSTSRQETDNSHRAAVVALSERERVCRALPLEETQKVLVWSEKGRNVRSEKRCRWFEMKGEEIKNGSKWKWSV